MTSLLITSGRPGQATVFGRSRVAAGVAALREAADHAAVDGDDCAGDVRSGGRQQEGSHASDLGGVAVSAHRDARDRSAAPPPRQSCRRSARVPASSVAMRSVATRPGAMPLMRTGAISGTSDLISPTRPGRIRLDVVSAGIGSRADEDRMTRIAGAIALAQVRQCRADRAARRTRAFHRSPAARPRRSRSSNLPGGGPPELTSSSVQAAEGLHRGRRRQRPVHRAWKGRWPAGRRQFRWPGLSVGRPERAAMATRAPSAASARATAAPSPADAAGHQRPRSLQVRDPRANVSGR